MAYQALYRVWRPQLFHDVVGQEHITKTLQNALMQEKFSHAYLFSGPRGTGKTSAAKILAKAINCENAPASEPCNECPSCVGITTGAISDVIEIDAASNNGVAEIRYIRDKVKLSPGVVKYKVYIIDEVHMLSEGAFNALLKTLEEPPKHVIFVLATTEPHKIPLTIISRCQRFDFRRIPSTAMVERMGEIVRSQGVQVEEKALQVIAQAAEGGMRDALSLLDQAISFSDDYVSEKDALSVTGAVSQSFLYDIAHALIEKNTVLSLQLVNELIRNGKEPVRFLEDAIFYFRDLLLFQNAPTLESLLEKSTVDDNFKELAQKTNAETIYFIIENLSQSQQEMKFTNHPQIFLEVALMKICSAKAEKVSEKTNSAEVNELQKKINYLEEQLKQIKEQGVPTAQQRNSTPEKRQQRLKTSPNRSTSKINAMLNHANKQALHQLKSNWAEIMEQLRKEKISAHATLLDSEPVAASDESFVLSFKYDIHCQMANDNRNIIESTVSHVMGKQLSMLEIPNPEWQRIKEEFIKSQKREEGNEKEEEQDPLIAEAMKLFGPDLIEIKE